MKYSDALNYIHSLNRFGSRPGLESITALLNAVGNPQKNIRFIHVAGTNGKGSVCAMTAKILELAGYKTGLYTSPFVISFRERIQINGEFIPKRKLSALAKILIDTGIEVTEFEFITALAFMYYKMQKCDVVVLETGLGGRLDATNVIDRPLASVITSISLDHTAVLGDTLTEIAAEKCGIIKPGCPVVTSPGQPEEAMAAIVKKCPDVIVPKAYSVINSGLDMRFTYENRNYTTRLIGSHQAENAVIAIEAVRACGLSVSKEAVSDGLAEAFQPARLEVIRRNPLIILDGAHNPAGARTLARQVKGLGLSAIVGIMADKDYEAIMKITAPLFKKIVTVTVKENVRSLSAEELAGTAKKYNANVTAAKTYLQAIAQTAGAGEPTVVYGSLYLASAIRPRLINIK